MIKTHLQYHQYILSLKSCLSTSVQEVLQIRGLASPVAPEETCWGVSDPLLGHKTEGLRAGEAMTVPPLPPTRHHRSLENIGE